MKKKLFAGLVLLVISIAVFGIISVTAETEGVLTYSVSNGEAKITDCDTTASGDLVIPSTLGGYPVTSIGGSAFFDCSSLESITIPDSVTSIGYGAFRYCNSLKSINVDTGNKNYSSLSGVLFDKNQTELICYPAGITNNQYSVPNSVTSIEDCAFWCSSLKSITIPDSVTSIGSYAFDDCSSLKSVTIPDGVTTIGNYSFCDCSSLESITIPDSVTIIGYDAFYNTAYYNNASNWDGDLLYIETYLIDAKDSIISANIKNGTKTIADFAFGGCSSLESITIPDSVTSIGYEVFYNCSSLESITIPDSVTSIGNRAFEYCSSLESVTIPDSVTSIGKKAFYNCSSLKSITIPDSVTSIGEDAFYGCGNVVIYGYEDSVAQQYATDNDIPFVLISDIPESITIGDANGDGEVDFTDAIVVLKHDAGVSSLTGDSLKLADTNGDGEVDFVDAIQILKYDSGLISSFK